MSNGAPRCRSRANVPPENMSGRVGRPRGILILLSQAFAAGGIQRFNRTLLAACAQLSLRVDVLVLADTQGDAERWQPPAGMRVRAFANRRLAYCAAVCRAVLTGSYDQVLVGHVHLLRLAVLARALAVGRRPSVLLVAHGLEVWHGLRGARRRAMRSVANVLCVSTYTRDAIRRQAPEIGAERFSLFPNALDDSWRRRADDAARARASVRLPPKFLLTVTRLTSSERAKGVVSVIEAMPMLSDDAVHLVIVGRGDDAEFLRGVARRLGVAERVLLLGAVGDAELADIYRRSIAFVLPSGQEGFGLVFIEAMYFGAPVIAAGAKGALDVVRHEETGLLVPFGDVVSIGASIERLLGDAELRARLASNARTMVTDRGEFTFDAFVARCAAVLTPTRP
jgi:phosphatidylinositol alpha-1,6-mannosyltransferase